MGRPPLKFKMLNIRFPPELVARIDALIGTHRPEPHGRIHPPGHRRKARSRRRPEALTVPSYYVGELWTIYLLE